MAGFGGELSAHELELHSFVLVICQHQSILYVGLALDREARIAFQSLHRIFKLKLHQQRAMCLPSLQIQHANEGPAFHHVQ